MKTESFLLKGDLCYSKDSTHLETVANGVLVCLEGRCAGVFPRVPEQYQGLPRYDFSGRLVSPAWWTSTSTHPSMPTGGWAWIWSCWTG